VHTAAKCLAAGDSHAFACEFYHERRDLLLIIIIKSTALVMCEAKEGSIRQTVAVSSSNFHPLSTLLPSVVGMYFMVDKFLAASFSSSRETSPVPLLTNDHSSRRSRMLIVQFRPDHYIHKLTNKMKLAFPW
jgi:hypothetical protein